MTGKFLSIKMRMLGWLQRQCKHPPQVVSHDIAEGSFSETVSWCRVCGAVKLSGSHFQNEPRADWWISEVKSA